MPTQPVVPPIPPTPPVPPIEWNGDTTAYQESWKEYERSMEAWEQSWTKEYEAAWEAYGQKMKAWALTYAAEALVGQEGAHTEHLAEMQEQLRVLALIIASDEMEQLQEETQQRELERAQRRLEAEQRYHQREIQREVERAQRELERAQRALEGEQHRLEAERRHLEFDTERLREGKMALKEAAIADGIIEDEDEKLVIRLDEGKLQINGKPITGDQYDRYLRILRHMGVEGAGQVRYKSD